MIKDFDTSALSPNIKLPIVIRFAGHQACEPSHDHGPSKRDHYIIHFVVKGKGTLQIHNKTYTVEAGQGFLIHPYDVTYYKADKDNPWEYYWIAWSGEFAENILNDIIFLKDQAVFKLNHPEKIPKHFEDIFDIYENNYNPYSLLGMFYLLLSNFAGNMIREDQILTQATSYIHSNYGSITSVNQIADYVFLSRSQLYRIFMKQLNQSPQEYLIDYRILRAQEFLESGVLSVEDIGKKCGFNSTTHFSNTFKKKTERTPSSYRRMREKDLGFFYIPV